MYVVGGLIMAQYRSHHSRLSFDKTLGALAIASLTIALLPSLIGSVTPVLAQSVTPQGQLFVDPTNGRNGSPGSPTAPLKTIAQALEIAQPNTVIQLAPGIYGTATGERFPLRLRPGVTLQGELNNQGQNTIIRGGNFLLSRFFGRQNITLLGADGATLQGVTVTNPNPRGYGLWIESSSPTVAHNTFTGSTQDGISVMGDSLPRIQDNVFRKNKANGITVSGDAQPEIRGNVFEDTGFGINVTQQSAPLIANNRILKNKDGVIIQAKAQPILRDNTFSQNQRDGLVAIATAFPDLGVRDQPGNNIFRNNGRYDINGLAAKETIPAFGNQLVRSRTKGRLDFSGVVTQPTLTSRYPRRTLKANPIASPNPVLLSHQRPQQTPTGTTSISIPVPLPESTTGIGFPPPTPTLQSATSGVLPLVVVPDTPSSVPSPPLPNNIATAGSRYRVLVATANAQEQAQVKSIVPGSFRTYAYGQMMMQAGVFQGRTNADKLAQRLRNNGFTIRVDLY